MKRTSALLAGTIAALAVLVIANAASAQTFLGPERVYPPPPPGGAGWRETPTYAPDAPPPRDFYNRGLPDRQLDAR